MKLSSSPIDDIHQALLFEADELARAGGRPRARAIRSAAQWLYWLHRGAALMLMKAARFRTAAQRRLEAGL